MAMEQQAQQIEKLIHDAEEGKVHFSEEQIHNLEKQAEFLHEHAGHEQTHSQMALIIITALIVAQFVLLWWKKYHYKSYQQTTTFGLWLLPFLFAAHSGMKQFMIYWFLYTILNSWIIYKATRQPLHHMTPKYVYKWFWVVYQASYITGIIGYFLLFITFVGLVPAVAEDSGTSLVVKWGVNLLSYGVYFGILGRDFVEFCTESMASTLGYYTKEGFPRKHLRLGVCAICGIHVSNAISTIDAHGHLQPPVLLQPNAPGAAGGAVEPSIKLNCGHEFHEECIRGWCLIGKKDMCPYCKEKVDLRAFKSNPWDTTQQLYLNLLDAIRYAVVWQPIIMLVVQAAFYVAGLE